MVVYESNDDFEHYLSNLLNVSIFVYVKLNKFDGIWVLLSAFFASENKLEYSK